MIYYDWEIRPVFELVRMFMLVNMELMLMDITVRLSSTQLVSSTCTFVGPFTVLHFLIQFPRIKKSLGYKNFFFEVSRYARLTK